MIPKPACRFFSAAAPINDMPLLHITDLDDYVKPFIHLRRPEANLVALSTEAAKRGSGPAGYFLPSDIRAAYYGKGSLTGAGQTVAIFSYDGYKSSELSLFYSKTGTGPSMPVNNVLVNGYSGVCVFHDVSRGSHGKFTAVPGYDLVTGWGSPIGPAFISVLLAK